MHTEPDLDPGVLADLVRDRYRLDVERLEFVPHGIDSWSYVAILRDGGRAFVKMVRQVRPDRTPVFGEELPLLAALADLRRLSVPRPCPDRDGRYVNRVDGFEVHVLEYLDGRNLAGEHDWPDALYARVAEVVAAVHASTDAVRSLVSRAERYELPFLPDLADRVRGLEDGRDFPAGDDPALTELRGLIAPTAAALEAAIGRLQQLRDQARGRRAESVLCHTDIWGSNLLLSDDGTVHLVDWGGALIGPPECDLFMFAGTGFFPADRFGWFLDRYEAAFRPVQLDADVFGFYFHRRNLEDLADFVATIADGKTDGVAATDILGFVVGLLAELPRLEDRIGQVRRVLRERSGG